MDTLTRPSSRSISAGTSCHTHPSSNGRDGRNMIHEARANEAEYLSEREQFPQQWRHVEPSVSVQRLAGDSPI